ncbi:MAG TPA: transporter substrate-binding domain-containing protein [Rubrivivax sp.]|nr:transporter substrate-binding domain-containing protein [Rubrivivax sp.]
MKTANLARAARRALLACCAVFAAGTTQAETALFDQLPAEIRTAGTIRLVGDSFAPYRIVGPDGKTVTGIETDIARALEPILGVRFEQTIVSNLPAILAGIDTGRYDLSSGPLLSTKPREQRYDIVTWLLSKPAFMLLVDGGRKTSRLEDLCGLRLSFAAGSSQELYANKVSERCVAAGRPTLQLVPLPDQNATVLAAQSGRADAASMQLSAALYLQSQNPGKFHIQTDETDGLGVLHLGFVTKKGSALSPVLLAALQRLWASGAYEQILAKWGLAAARAPAPMLNPSSR